MRKRVAGVLLVSLIGLLFVVGLRASYLDHERREAEAPTAQNVAAAVADRIRNDQIHTTECKATTAKALKAIGGKLSPGSLEVQIPLTTWSRLDLDGKRGFLEIFAACASPIGLITAVDDRNGIRLGSYDIRTGPSF